MSHKPAFNLAKHIPYSFSSSVLEGYRSECTCCVHQEPVSAQGVLWHSWAPAFTLQNILMIMRVMHHPLPHPFMGLSGHYTILCLATPTTAAC